MLKQLLFVICAMSVCSMVYAEEIYVSNQGGVPSFSNVKPKNTKSVIVDEPEPTTTDMVNITQQMISTTVPRYSQAPQYRSNDATMQGDFPEAFTDNYFDFYGNNHTYHHLMSSVTGEGTVFSSGRNNDRLREAY